MPERTNIWGGTFDISIEEEDHGIENGRYYDRTAYQSDNHHRKK